MYAALKNTKPNEAKQKASASVAEVNHFEKRNKDSILHFSCNQRFGRVMAFLCPMDVSVV